MSLPKSLAKLIFAQYVIKSSQNPIKSHSSAPTLILFALDSADNYNVTNFLYEYYYVNAVLFPIYANFGRDFLKMISLTPVFVPQMGSLGTGIYQIFHKYKLLLPLSDVT